VAGIIGGPIEEQYYLVPANNPLVFARNHQRYRYRVCGLMVVMHAVTHKLW
jgi:hypothetical protein